MGVVSWLSSLGKKTLYYPGTFSSINEEEIKYKEIFERLGIQTVQIEGKPFTCGHELLEAGYKKEARNLAKRNFERLKKAGVNKIITSSAQSYYMLTEIYPTFIPGWDVEIEHSITSILNALRQKGVAWNEEQREQIVYHDPCYLTRYVGMYDEPRTIIELLGGEIIEMRRNKEQALCCGAGGGVIYNYPSLAKEMAQLRLKDNPTNTNKIITPCALCTKNFRSVTGNDFDFCGFILARLRRMQR